MVRDKVTMEGHLIDSDILRRAMSRVVEGGGQLEVEEFNRGRTNSLACKVEAGRKTPPGQRPAPGTASTTTS